MTSFDRDGLDRFWLHPSQIMILAEGAFQSDQENGAGATSSFEIVTKVAGPTATTG